VTFGPERAGKANASRTLQRPRVQHSNLLQHLLEEITTLPSRGTREPENGALTSQYPSCSKACREDLGREDSVRVE
jgi:hypothetical protein